MRSFLRFPEMDNKPAWPLRGAIQAIVMNTSTISSICPTSATERIIDIDIDILRGLALFGILVVNVHFFCAPDAFYADYFEKFSSRLDDSIFHAVNFLFSGKFYPVFSFLFGWDFLFSFRNSNKRESMRASFSSGD